MIIIAIDPGTSNTGIAIYDDSKKDVIACKTIRTKASGQDQNALYSRCINICCSVNDIMCEYCADLLVIEGFTSFGGARQSANTFQTPFLVGMICGICDVLHIQTSNKVFTKYGRSVRDSIKDGTCSVEGCEKATNDHERSALCHALYYANGGKW